MSTITKNTSVTLNGSKSFKLGGDTYQWNNRFLFAVDTWAPDDSPLRTVTFTLSGKDWGVRLLSSDGNSKTVIKDSSTGGVYVNFISLGNVGPNTVTLKNAVVDVINGYDSADTVSIGSSAGSILLGGGNNKVTVTGEVGNIRLGSDNDTVKVDGAGWVGSIDTGRGKDKVTLAGTAEVDNIQLGRGDDTLVVGSTAWVGTVDAGRGNDTVTINGSFDYIALGRDADTIKFGAKAQGGGIVNAGEGVSEDIEGAADFDTVDFSAFSKALTIELDAGRASADGFSVQIRNFEKAIAGKGADTLVASDDVNHFRGGAGADTFVFRSVKAADGDTILDFSKKQGDQIDLRGIDADTTADEHQSFTFIGKKAFTKTAGELRSVKKSGDTFVSGDVDGDGQADFTITIDASITFAKGDFIL